MDNQSQLTMTDMASLVTIVEVACNRGAFRADEMTLVGGLYDKLRQFVQQQRTDDAGTTTETPQDSQGESDA